MVNINIYVNEPLTFDCIERGDAFVYKENGEYTAYIKLVKEVETSDYKIGKLMTEFNAITFNGQLTFFSPEQRVIPAKVNINIYPATISPV